MIIRKEENIEKRSSFGVAILKYLIITRFFVPLPLEYKGVLAGMTPKKQEGRLRSYPLNLDG